MSRKVSLCVPMYNERAVIADTARALHAYMSEHFEDYEILFSDDGSSDGSADVVRALNLPRVRVVGYDKNRGKGCAVRTAILAADGDIVMFTDADLAYGVEVIRRLYDAFDEDPSADMVFGSRNLTKDGYREYTPLRRLASKTYIRILCLVGGFRLTDSQCGCKAFTREAAREIFPRMQVDGFAFDSEAILWANRLGKRIREIPVRVVNHRASKVHVFSDTFRILADLRRMKRRIRRADLGASGEGPAA